MKYVMFEIDFAGTKKRVPVMFPDMVVHSLMAEGFADVLIKHGWKDVKVVSAGECTVYVDNIGGKSDTLGVASAGADDAVTINTYDYLHGLI